MGAKFKRDRNVASISNFADLGKTHFSKNDERWVRLVVVAREAPSILVRRE